MAVIFYFSSRSDPLDFVRAPTQTGSFEPLIHLLEYTGLLLLLHRALPFNPPTSAEKGQGRHSATRPWRAISIAVLYALSDEFHQEIVPGRSFEVIDIAYDLFGIAVALALIRTWTALRLAPIRRFAGSLD